MLERYFKKTFAWWFSNGTFTFNICQTNNKRTIEVINKQKKSTWTIKSACLKLREGLKRKIELERIMSKESKIGKIKIRYKISERIE